MTDQTSTLDELVTSDVPLISETAQKTQQYIAELNSGQISQSEYKELIADLTRLDNIDQELFTIEVYREITKAFEYIATLKSIASLI